DRYPTRRTRTIATVTDVVMTGRWMHSAGRFIASLALCHRHRGRLRRPRGLAALHGNPRAVGEAELAVHHDAVARREPFGDHGPAVKRAVDAYQPHFDGRVQPDQERVRAVLPDLDGGARHHDGVRLHADGQGDVDELPGPQPGVVVCELCLERDGTGCDIDLVVDEDERASDRRLRLAPDGRDPP